MAQINPFDFAYKLMGSGSQARYDQIDAWLEQGGDILSSGGSRIWNTTIATGGIALTSATYVDMTGWVSPSVVYTGQPILMTLYVPAIQSDTANAVTSFRVVDGSGFVLASVPINTPLTTKTYGGFGQVEIPIAGHYAMTAGNTYNFKVQGLVSAGATTIHTYINNGFAGSTPVIFRGSRS